MHKMKLLRMRWKILLHSKYNIWILLIFATIMTFIQSIILFRADQSFWWIVFDITWIVINIAAFIVSVWNVLHYLLNRKQLNERNEK